MTQFQKPTATSDDVKTDASVASTASSHSTPKAAIPDSNAVGNAHEPGIVALAQASELASLGTESRYD